MILYFLRKCNLERFQLLDSNLYPDQWIFQQLKESGVFQQEPCARWSLWPERQFQSPIKSTRRLRWVMCSTMSDDTEHIPSFLSPIQSTNLRTCPEDLGFIYTDRFESRMPWCVVWRQPQQRRGCRQPETNSCTPVLSICVC